MNLDDEQVAEVMAASFPRTREVLLRLTVARFNDDGNMVVTLDPGERIVGVEAGQRGPLVWVSLGEDKEVEDLRRWKAEAECVIEEWDHLWEMAGCLGELGKTKAAGLLAALQSDGVI